MVAVAVKKHPAYVGGVGRALKAAAYQMGKK
jgi:hypothetical protein